MALYWLRAQQARTPEDVYKAAEGVLRGLIALLLADVVHAPLSEADVTTLLGGPDRRGLEKPSFGKRIELLRALVRMHASVPEPVLEGVAAWWSSADGPAGVLQRLVETRNAAAHGAGVRTEGELRAERHAATAALATLLRAAPFLRSTQLVHLEGTVRVQRGRQHGSVRRLAGAAPYMLLAETADWPLTFVLEDRRVYMGRADGKRWVVQPFIVLGEGGRDTGGQPRPSVFDTVRRGQMQVLEPFAGTDERAEIHDEAWNAVSWEGFLQRRASIVGGWTQTLPEPPTALVRVIAGDMTDGLQPGMVLDDYRLVQKLGEGGAAVVWEVEDVHDGRAYALKVMKGDVGANDAEVRRFEGEVATMKRLHAAGCARVVGPVVSFRVDDGGVRRVVLRMPLLRETLKDQAASLRAAAGGANPDADTVTRWLTMALEALVQMHAQGVVHRDVKPSNFLLDESGELFVSDLGVARDTVRREPLTRTGEVVGTDLYMAPEQRMGSRDIGPAADVYALAVCIDELWLGAPRITPGKGQSGVVAELLQAMSQLDPDARPTAAAALERLAAAMTSGVSGAASVSPSPRSVQVAPPERRREPSAGASPFIMQVRERLASVLDGSAWSVGGGEASLIVTSLAFGHAVHAHYGWPPAASPMLVSLQWFMARPVEGRTRLALEFVRGRAPQADAPVREALAEALRTELRSRLGDGVASDWGHGATVLSLPFRVEGGDPREHAQGQDDAIARALDVARRVDGALRTVLPRVLGALPDGADESDVGASVPATTAARGPARPRAAAPSSEDALVEAWLFGQLQGTLQADETIEFAGAGIRQWSTGQSLACLALSVGMVAAAAARVLGPEELLLCMVGNVVWFYTRFVPVFLVFTSHRLLAVKTKRYWLHPSPVFLGVLHAPRRSSSLDAQITGWPSRHLRFSDDAGERVSIRVNWSPHGSVRDLIGRAKAWVRG
jgi:serine/threonine-protein kinase